MNLQNWVAKVVAERARILARIGTPAEPKPDPVAENEAIYRAAAALLAWEKATGVCTDPKPLTPEEETSQFHEGRR